MQSGGPAGRTRSLQDARRPFEAQGRGGRPGDPRGESRAEPPVQSAAEGRTLVVGQGIRLAGEIKRCETLVVEGEVEANLTDCLSLEINDSGLFKGAAVVEQAEISGRLEGELTVNGRLFVRASGQLRGTIRYADLEIERGGRIAGSVDVIEPPAVEEPAVEEPAAEAPLTDRHPESVSDALPDAAEVVKDGEPARAQGETSGTEDEPKDVRSGSGKASRKNTKDRSDADAGSEALI